MLILQNLVEYHLFVYNTYDSSLIGINNIKYILILITKHIYILFTIH